MAAALVLAPTADAQLTQNLTISPKALSLGNAVTADPPGIMAIHYNPAGLTRLDNREFELNMIGAYLDIDADFRAPEGYNIFDIDGLETDPFTGEQRDPVANTHSHTNRLSLYVPRQGMVKWPLPIVGAPSGGISVRSPGSKLTFATAAFFPQAAGFNRDLDDPGRYLAQSAAIQRLTYLSPTIAYKVNDEWSVGLGVHLSHQGIAADQYLRAPNLLLGVAQILQDAFSCEEGDEPLAPLLQICGGNVGPWDDIGGLSLKVEEAMSPTYALGVMWEPTPWFTWGASYTSEADMKLKGTYHIEYTPDWSGFWQSVNASILGAISSAVLSLPAGAPREIGNVSMELPYPQHFQTGMAFRVHPLISFSMDFGWTDYSGWDAFDLQFDRNLEFLGAARILSPENATQSTLRLPLGFKDVWNWGFGGTLHPSSRLSLRAGIEQRTSVIPDNQRQTLAPFGDTYLYSVGLGYEWDKNTTIDMNLSFIQSIEYIKPNTSCNVNCDDISNIVYNPYAALDVSTRLRLALAGISFRKRF